MRSPTMENLKYTIIIRWSDEDEAFLVELPEFFDGLQRYRTHGSTYQEAFTNALQALEMLVEHHQQQGRPLPPVPMSEVCAGI
ncbi:hypothetical protein GKIL_0647 [Gloeobacter kilaueensis JS1]|uniref:HicB-like antitoxin of toxin-antitoxin system domain-containing protein n=2 Tax=Gloeobacter TaxID=33071 RepID=U5QDH5_GLOK1|nr:hypothetical protein GKIL_0647 [Gloeobacter kilaueensis JS1]